MKESDIAYFRKRAIQEQVAAQKALCPTARNIHDELATMYRFRVSLLSDAWSEAGTAIALKNCAQYAAQKRLRVDQEPPTLAPVG